MVLLKKMFITLLTSTFKVSDHTKCISLNNQPSKSQHTFIIFYILMNTFKNYATIYLQLTLSAKLSLKGCVYDSPVNYDAIATPEILNIHKYLMVKNNIK